MLNSIKSIVNSTVLQGSASRGVFTSVDKEGMTNDHLKTKLQYE